MVHPQDPLQDEGGFVLVAKGRHIVTQHVLYACHVSVGWEEGEGGERKRRREREGREEEEKREGGEKVREREVRK